jgi:hypothetical protein
VGIVCPLEPVAEVFIQAISTLIRPLGSKTANTFGIFPDGPFSHWSQSWRGNRVIRHLNDLIDVVKAVK